MKILEERYPLGTLPGQQTDGRYINKTYYENLKLLAKAIKKDMTFLGIITSSTLEVGTGKSVFAQQSSEAYLECIRQIHEIDNRLSMNNLVFRPKDIIERSFQVPRYSVVICDEWEDAHYWSELGTTLRKFFRKCRQLNLFIWVIIPNFFQLPSSYAISRSVCLIDVKFMGEFDRGYFSFYNFQRKKRLYIKGKKEQNYDCVKPNFTGRFVDGYVVNEEEYRYAKMNDLLRQEEMEKPEMSKRMIIIIFLFGFVNKLRNMGYKIPDVHIAEASGVVKKTIYRWRKRYEEYISNRVFNDLDNEDTLLVYPTQSDDIQPKEKQKEIAPIIREARKK